MTDRADPRGQDWPGLDLFKCLGIVGMILCHSVDFILTDSGRLLIREEHPAYAFIQSMVFLGFFPMILPFIAGATFYDRMAPRLSDNSWTLPPTLLMQCVVVASVGYAMNVLAAGWYALYAWNVLQMVAVSMLVIATLTTGRFGVWPVAFAGLLLLAVSDPLRQWWPAESRPEIVRILLGDPQDWHIWPLVPWFSLVAFGFLMAHCYQKMRSTAAFAASCVLLGIGLMITAALQGLLIPALDQENLIGPAVMQPPAMAVLGILGVAMLLCGALTAIQSKLRLARFGLVRCYSAGILWIYLVHLSVGVRLSEIIFTNHFQRGAVLADPLRPDHLTLLIGFPLGLLLMSWLVGYLTLLVLHEKRFKLSLRRIHPA